MQHSKIFSVHGLQDHTSIMLQAQFRLGYPVGLVLNYIFSTYSNIKTVSSLNLFAHFLPVPVTVFCTYQEVKIIHIYVLTIGRKATSLPEHLYMYLKAYITIPIKVF